MSLKKVTLMLLSVFVVFSVVLAGCGPQAAEGNKGSDTQGAAKTENDSNDGEQTFNIGMAISMTGGTALFGEGVKRGVNLAIDEFNEAGGFKGQKANLVLYDDEAKPEKSVEVVQRLINQDNIVALIGPANSGNALAHIQFVQDAKIPEVVPVATATKITQQFAGEPKNYIFRVSALDSVQVSAILKELIEKQGLKKLGVIHDTEGYGQGGRTDIEKQLKENYNMEAVKYSAFDPKELNLEQPIRDMKKAGVEAVIFYGLAPQSAKLLEARNKEGLDVPIYATWATGDPTVVKLVGDLVNKNVFFVQSFTVDQSDKSRAFDQKIVDKYKENIFPIASAQGYDSAKLILDAIKKADSLEGEKIRDAIENIDDFEGVTSISKKPYSKENHEAYSVNDVFIATYKDTKIVKAN
jgi:branched-chain amino acid transport system substrate-binding protein